MKIDPSAPAFPHHVYPQRSGPGLTIRAHFAAMAMQGILGARKGFMIDCGVDNFALWAVQCADALIAALNAEDKG